MCQVAWVDEDARLGLDKYIRGYLTRKTSKWNCETSEGDLGACAVSDSPKVYVLAGQEGV